MASIVSTDVVVPCQAERARSRLSALPNTFTMTIGPRRHWLLKRVGARLGDPHGAGRTSISQLRWTPTGPYRNLFPVLRANVVVTGIDDTTCLLTVAGAYRPPLGGLGRLADRAILHRLAESTATDFAERLAHTLATNQREGPS